MLIEQGVVLLILLFLGLLALVFLASRSIESLKHKALRDVENEKLKKAAEFESAKEFLRSLVQRKAELEQELSDLREADKPEEAEPDPGLRLAPEDWLLKEGHLTLEQMAKATEIRTRSNMSSDLVGACVMLGLISKEVARKAIDATRSKDRLRPAR
jgi:hypothetical protein